MKLSVITIAFVCVNAFVALVTPALAELTPQEISQLADQANTFFHQANEQIKSNPDQAKELYQKAILRYQKIIDEGGIANGYLHYNLANAYLLKGAVGPAILHYRRAERFGMAEADLAKNLNFARTKRLDQIPIKTRKQVLQTLFFWHYDVCTKTRFLLACCCWALACLAGALWVWRRRSLPLWLTGAGLLLTICLAGSVVVDTLHARSDAQGVIVAESVVARQGDGENYPVSFTEPLHSGAEFDLLERRSNWLRIKLANDEKTWIPTAAAEII